MRSKTTAQALHGALEAFSELVWPTRCIGCNLPGELLCPDCRARLPWIAQRWACPLCGAPFGWLVCTQCDRSVHEARWPLRATICAFPFEGAAAAMPAALKDAHELRLANVMAAAMACALDEASLWPAEDGQARFDGERIDGLCFVPATAQAYARRGFDHMELISKALSSLIDIPLNDVLVRDSAYDQRELGRDERARNLAGSIDVIGDVANSHLLVVDDVITTGASICEAARALLMSGVASVTACAFTRVW